MTTLREQCIEVWWRTLTGAMPFTMSAREARGWCSEYLGRLLQANGCKTIDEIVQAAADVFDTHPESCRECSCKYSMIGFGGTAIGCECDCHTVFNPLALFAAIITEALAKGRDETFEQSWFERYGIAEFEVPASYIPRGTTRWACLFDIPALYLPTTNESSGVVYGVAEHVCSSCYPCENCGRKKCRGECLSQP